MALKGRIDVFPTECTLSYANGAFSEIGRGRSVKKKHMKREYLIPANPGLMPTEKWETCRNTGVRQFFTKPRFCWLMRSANSD